jgi:rare lipoprotein A
MVVRLSAVICGAAIVFACSSAAMARSEPSHAANRAGHDTSILGTASTYNPYRPGYREGGGRAAGAGGQHKERGAQWLTIPKAN